jgi:hypothetical protein
MYSLPEERKRKGKNVPYVLIMPLKYGKIDVIMYVFGVTVLEIERSKSRFTLKRVFLSNATNSHKQPHDCIQ